MRLTASEKAEIIRVVKNSALGVNHALRTFGIHKRTFYNWYHRYEQFGEEGLLPRRKTRQQWNSIPKEVKNLVEEVALDHTELSSREVAVKIIDEHNTFISESSVYRILLDAGIIERCQHRFMAAADEYHTKTQFPNQMWQTDFTYFKVKGWGWYYLSTVLDDYSRYIIHWELCSNMAKEDVQRTIERALKKAGLSKDRAPKLLSDNGPCYIAHDLENFLQQRNITHIHGAPLHPQTQGKIERYHQSMKNIVLLHNYFHPSQLHDAIALWVGHYNEVRYHESLSNLTPADVYFGRVEQILKQRQIIKQQSLENRKLSYLQNTNSQLNSVNLQW